jgi:hypothetical protein
MSALKTLFRVLFALFVDDRGLALGLLAVVACAGVLAALAPGLSLAAGAVLLLGCLGVLAANVMRTTLSDTPTRTP